MNANTAQKTTTVPTRSIWSSLGLAALVTFSYFQFVGYIIPGLQEISDSNHKAMTLHHIGLMWVPIIEYLLSCSVLCLAVNIFKPLKRWRENGVVVGFAGGLVGSLVVGSILSLATGSMFGLVWSLTFGFAVGLFWGFAREFE